MGDTCSYVVVVVDTVTVPKTVLAVVVDVVYAVTTLVLGVIGYLDEQ